MTFYQHFDTETLEPRFTRDDEYRTPFQVDRDRVIHTSAFRSLQSKTQVFLSGQYDFYRTRLTHSIEVAQIGRSICAALNRQSPHLLDDYLLDPHLVEAICLAHDLGHPPFGHCGERTLNRLMAPFGGFEGNAQTLRLLTQTIYSGKGMAPTRAFLDGVLKYKTLHAELRDPENHFLYTDQSSFLDFALGDRDFPAELTPGDVRNGFRSIECQIMDWADDTAYSLHDVVDGVRAGFITIERLERWNAAQEDHEAVAPIVEGLLDTIRQQKLEGRIGRKIGDFIAGCRLVEDANFLSETSQRYRYRLEIDDFVQHECSVHKRIALDLVFKTPQLQQLDHKADFMLTRLFDAFANTYFELKRDQKPKLRLLEPDQEEELLSQEGAAPRARILCDLLAQMTEGNATQTYKRLFDPNFGSIADLI
ncbi:MAG: dGTP triphosphohydrolase [Verrucomicrobiota bacterium]